jgi:hypothetical protein
MQQPTSAPSAPDLSETHARLTLALGTALGPLVAFLDDLLVVEIMLNADGASWVERRGILLGCNLYTAAEPLVRAIAQSTMRCEPTMGPGGHDYLAVAQAGETSPSAPPPVTVRPRSSACGAEGGEKR